MGRHPTGSRSSFPTKMASKFEEIHTEGNSVNDLTGFKAGKTLGKLTRKGRGESPRDFVLLDDVVVVGRHRAQNILEGSSLTSLSGAEGTGASSDD